MILEFVENFGSVMKDTDDKYKLLLRQLFESIAPSSSGPSPSSSDNIMEKSSSIASSSPLEMEERFDDLLSTNREAYTPGFVRYIDGECIRLESLLTQSQGGVTATTTVTNATTASSSSSSSSHEETTKMIQILRVIQTRILDEIGKEHLGEGAIVLGQLLGYDNDNERLAVLDAGLAVRGYDYAIELRELTKNALVDFNKIMTRNVEEEEGIVVVDPELIRRVETINRRIEEYIIDGANNNQDFQ